MVLAVLAACGAKSRLAAHAGKDAAWNGFNVLHTAAARVAGLDLGFVPGRAGATLPAMLSPDMHVVYLLGADECDLRRSWRRVHCLSGQPWRSSGAARADVILPGAAYTEKSATYVNTEGRVQQTVKAASRREKRKRTGPSSARCRRSPGKRCRMTRFQELRAAMYKARRNWPRSIRSSPQCHGIDSSPNSAARRAGAIPPAFPDFYLTNPIARASA